MSKDKVNTLVETLLEKVNRLEDFSLEHAPDVCKELIKVKIVRCQNGMIEAGIVLAIALPVFITCLIYGMDFKEVQDSWGTMKAVYQNTEAVGILCGVFGFISTLATIISFIALLSEALKIREINAGHKYHILKDLSNMVGK